MSQSADAPPSAFPGPISAVRLPVPAQTFERRAARFTELAPGHSAADYLTFLAALAQAQVRACQEVSLLPQCNLSPPIPFERLKWRRDGGWQKALRVILGVLSKADLPEAARTAVAAVSVSPSDELEAWADAVLGGLYEAVNPRAAPFVGAALQVYWTALAAGPHPGDVERSEGNCPLCGSTPSAGIVEGNGVRYLACALCAAEWHLPRLTCAACRSTAHLSYLALEGDTHGVKAETCEDCRTYLKLFSLERSPRVEAVADDVATLALDLLMAEEGYARSAVNPFLLPGPVSA